MKHQFTVILPTYDEIENVLILIEQILNLRSIAEIKILVVDDDSPDGTASAVEKKYISFPNIKVLNRKGRPKGLVNSLNDGIKISDTEFLIWMDADLQMPVDKLPELIERLVSGHFTAVFGSRFIPGGDDVRDYQESPGIPTVHKFLSKLLSFTGRILLDLPATDLTSGFVAIRKSFFSERVLAGHYGEYFIVLLDDLHRGGFSFIEIPYCLGKRGSGSSKSTQGSYSGMAKTGKLYLKVIWKIFIRRYQ